MWRDTARRGGEVALGAAAGPGPARTAVRAAGGHIGERLRGAREDLARRDSRTIAMVAGQWGFSDPTHFTRRFRAAYGITPSEWRRIGAEPGLGD